MKERNEKQISWTITTKGTKLSANIEKCNFLWGKQIRTKQAKVLQTKGIISAGDWFNSDTQEEGKAVTMSKLGGSCWP